MNSQQKRKSNIINDKLVEKIMKRLINNDMIENFTNEFYDFNYIMGIPKGGIEPKIEILLQILEGEIETQTLDVLLENGSKKQIYQ